MKQNNITFVSTLTAPGQGGISVILLCGPDAEQILSQTFQPAAKMRFSRRKNNQFFYGHIAEGGEVIDEVILFPLSKSFSPFGESAFEINCHGGVAVTDAIIDALCRLGARRVDYTEALRKLADSGRISAVEFEARRELARATSPLAVKMVLAQLRGALTDEVERISVLMLKNVGKARARILKLLGTAWTGIFLCEAPSVFVSGCPNVGKSTLFNRLCGSQRVIVHETPGTTRDVITETVLVDGMAVRLSDSAGVGASSTEMERLAERFARKALKSSDFILFVLDSSRKLNSFEKRFLPSLDSEKSILIINKTDLPSALKKSELPESVKTVRTSALKEAGIEEVKAAMIREIVGEKIPPLDRAMVFTRRQKRLLEAALQNLENGKIDSAGRDLVRIFHRGVRRERREKAEAKG